MSRKSKKILILCDEPTELMVVGLNGSLTLALSFAKKGYEVFCAKEVTIGSEINFIAAQQICFTPNLFETYNSFGDLVRGGIGKNKKLADFFLANHKNSWKILAPEKIPYHQFDLILNRLDPINNYSWMRDQMDKLRVISTRHQVKIVGLSHNIDKYEPLAISEKIYPETIIIPATLPLAKIYLDEVEKMLKKHQALVIKPAKSGQGKGVKKISKKSEITPKIQEILEEFNGQIEGGLVIQEMLFGATRGDVRSIFYRNKNGKFIYGGSLARVQSGHNFINCVSSGRASIRPISELLTAKEIRELEQKIEVVSHYLNQHRNKIDSPIIGVDFIPKFADLNDIKKSRSNLVYIGEINFLCVALFNTIDHLNGVSVFDKNSLTAKIVEGLEA